MSAEVVATAVPVSAMNSATIATTSAGDWRISLASVFLKEVVEDDD